MSEQDTESPMLSPGARLTAAREQAGWSLVQTADRLHLDVATVKALEAGQFEALGAVVYARGHLRRYAELLGLPADELEAAYTQSNPPRRQPDLRRTSPPLQNTAARAGAVRPGTVAIGAVILVMGALVWWAMHVPRARSGAAGPVPAATRGPAGESSAQQPPADAGLGLKLGQDNWPTVSNPLARGDTVTGSGAANTPAAASGRLFDGATVPGAAAAPPPARSHPQRP